MRTYRQYCPIARSSEILAERWTPLIVRNLLWGCTTFTEIARGVPAMSRSMLIKRLRDLQRAGVIVASPKEDGAGSRYRLTEAGQDLAGVIDEMAAWGIRWLEVTTEHADPGFALWAWVTLQLDRSTLPTDRTVVSFVFPDESPGNRYYWLLAENGEAELCYSDPGGDVDAEVTARSLPFVRWHSGALTWASAVRSGAIEIVGDRRVVRALSRWNTHRPVVA